MTLAVPAKTILTIILDNSPLPVVQEVNEKAKFEYDTKGILGYKPKEVIIWQLSYLKSLFFNMPFIYVPRLLKDF